MADHELDVRSLHESDKHATVVRRYDELAVGSSLVVMDDDDPRELREAFGTDQPRGHGWEYLQEGPEVWRIRISKLASTSLPRVLCDTASLAAVGEAGATGAIWRLPMRERELDSNVVQLAPGGGIDAHTGPDLDVLIHVIRGSGRLSTEIDALDIGVGELLWLPRRSRRRFTAGPDGLTYLTVHRRRQALTLAAPPPRTGH